MFEPESPNVVILSGIIWLIIMFLVWKVPIGFQKTPMKIIISIASAVIVYTIINIKAGD